MKKVKQHKKNYKYINSPNNKETSLYQYLHKQKNGPYQNRFSKALLSNIGKQPLLLIGTTILFVILIIPAAIVLFTIENNDIQSVAVEHSPVENLSSTDPTLLVSIQRTATEEVENVPLETYVARVVASEMPAE